MTGPPARGVLIAIEGIDGTGKSTLAAALAVALRARGERVTLSYEPTSGPHGRLLRERAASGAERFSPEEEAELFRLDRQEHVAQVIEPALATGQVVILDRYYYSTMAYQGARGLDPAAIERDNRAVAPAPDLLVLLDLPVEAALERITAKRGSIPDHYEGAEYLAAVAAVFATVRHPHLLKLDAQEPTATLVRRILTALDGED